MKKLGRASHILVLLIFLVGLCGPAATPAVSGVIRAHSILQQLAAQSPDQAVTVIVQKAGATAQAEALVATLGGKVTRDLHIINAFTAEMKASKALKLAASPLVRWVSPDAPVRRSSEDELGGEVDPSILPDPSSVADPNSLADPSSGMMVNSESSLAATNGSGLYIDHSFVPSFYIDSLRVRPVWLMGLTGQGVTVAVIDSGISQDGDFALDYTPGSPSRVLFETSFSGTSTTVDDAYGHGTHVSGIIAGNGAGSRGLYPGIAPKANLLNIKVSDATGAAAKSEVVAALQWVFDNKAAYNIRVVNLSLNSTLEQSYHTSPLDAACEILWFNGVIVVVSAGNIGVDGQPANPIMSAPANDPFVITVGAADEKGNIFRADDVIASFTPYGTSLDGSPKPDIVAPGKGIISVLSSTSTWAGLYPERVIMGGQYFRLSGTSMSTPMVTGAIALLLQHEPNLTPDQVKYRLVNTGSVLRTRDGRTIPYLNVMKTVFAQTTESSNTGQIASQLLWTGDDPIAWDSVAWNSVAWNSVAWNSVAWNSVAWNSVAWNSVVWDK